MNAGGTGSSETVYFELPDLRLHKPRLPAWVTGVVLTVDAIARYRRTFSNTAFPFMA